MPNSVLRRGRPKGRQERKRSLVFVYRPKRDAPKSSGDCEFHQDRNQFCFAHLVHNRCLVNTC